MHPDPLHDPAFVSERVNGETFQRRDRSFSLRFQLLDRLRDNLAGLVHPPGLAEDLTDIGAG